MRFTSVCLFSSQLSDVSLLFPAATKETGVHAHSVNNRISKRRSPRGRAEGCSEQQVLTGGLALRAVNRVTRGFLCTKVLRTKMTSG